MKSVNLADGEFYGRVSTPVADPPNQPRSCSRCGSSLAGRLDRVERHRGVTTWIWKCGCGRRRHQRREAVAV